MTFAVWESDYPDDGATLYEAWTEKGARRRYRKDVGERGGVFGMPELDAVEATPTSDGGWETTNPAFLRRYESRFS